MISFGGQTYSLSDPLTLAAALALGGFILLFLLLFLSLRAANRSARAAEPLARHVQSLGASVIQVDRGQAELAGRLQQVTEAQISTQARLLHTMELRLEEVQRSMGESLHGTATRTARSLGELQTRLETIDKAQSNIEKLSGNVLSLQDILANKQTRGAFGEIQLKEIVAKALPSDAYDFQVTLSNGKRADCMIRLPNPPGPIAIDSKFPLEPYEALLNAADEPARLAAARQMKVAVRTHIRAIADKYIIEGETADGALMFLPSEAVYAELHANFPQLVREGFAAKVWIVSPTTCMATLNTMRAVLKDARMREQAGAIRRELGLLHRDLDRLGERVNKLDTHFSQAAKDVEDIKISATKAGNRALRLETFEFDDADAATPHPQNVAPIGAHRP